MDQSLPWGILLLLIPVALLIFIKPFIGLLLFVAVIPLESSFLSFGGGVVSGTRLLGIYVFITWGIQEVFHHRKTKFPLSFKLALALICWGGITYLWALVPNATVDRFLSAIQLVFLSMLVINQVDTRKKLIAILTALFVGCIIVTLLGLTGIGVENTSRLLTLQDQGAREYGIYVGIAFLMSTILMFYNKGRLRWLGLLVMLISIMPIVSIAERGVFLAIGFVWIVLAFVSRQKTRTIAVLILFILFLYFIPQILEDNGLINSYISNRLTLQSVMASGGSGRSDIWNIGLSIFLQHFFFGVGFGNFSYAFAQFTGFQDALLDSHADWLAVAAELGIVGLSIFLGLLASLGWKFKNILGNRLGVWGHTNTLLVFALFVYIVSSGITSTLLFRKVYWLILSMAIVISNLTAVDSFQSERPQNSNSVVNLKIPRNKFLP